MRESCFRVNKGIKRVDDRDLLRHRDALIVNPKTLTSIEEAGRILRVQLAAEKGRTFPREKSNRRIIVVELPSR